VLRRSSLIHNYFNNPIWLGWLGGSKKIKNNSIKKRIKNNSIKNNQTKPNPNQKTRKNRAKIEPNKKKPSKTKKNRAKPSQKQKNQAKLVWTGFCSKKSNRNQSIWTNFYFLKKFNLIFFLYKN
jgi:hypothetical protein